MRKLFCILILALASTLAYGQRPDQIELPCPVGSSPTWMGQSYDQATGKYRQWQCVKQNGTVTQAITDSGNGGQVFNVKAYGAKGDGKSVYDATMPSTGASLGSIGNSTSPATPGGTANFSGDVVLSIYGIEGSLTPPALPTQRAYIAGVNASHDGIWMGDQNLASAGAFTGNTGTQASSYWTALNLPLAAKSGTSIAFVSVASNSTTAQTLSISVPSGYVAGDALIACIGFYPTASSYYYKTPSGWSAVSTQLSGSTSGIGLTCFSRTAAASEPASYSFSFSGATGGLGAGFIAVYSNVAAIDSPITSASAPFVSSDQGKLVCASVSDPSSVTGTISNCNTVGIVSGTSKIYSLFGNPSVSSTTVDDLRWASDDTTAFNAAIAAASQGGTLMVPPGQYGLSSGFTFDVSKVLNVEGAGSGLSQYLSNSGQFASIPNSGSVVEFLTNSLGTAGFLFPPNTVDGWQWATNEKISNLTIRCGAGISGVGCGQDGIDSYWQRIRFDNIAVVGFSGDGIKISNNDGTTSTYASEVKVTNSLLSYNGGSGLEITGSGKFNQNIYVANNEIDNNGVNGIRVDGVPLEAALFLNNIIQWNARNGTSAGNTGSQFYSNVSLNGVSIAGNWIEWETAYTDGMIIGVGSAIQGPAIRANYFYNGSAGSPDIYMHNVYGVSITDNHTFGSTTLLDPTSTFFTATIDNTNTNDTTSNKGVFTAPFTGTSGTALCSENITGGVMRVSCVLNGYAQTGTAQTWTFPFPFTVAPILQESGGSCGSYNPSTTTTVITLPANASMTAESCNVEVSGQ